MNEKIVPLTPQVPATAPVVRTANWLPTEPNRQPSTVQTARPVSRGEIRLAEWRVPALTPGHALRTNEAALTCKPRRATSFRRLEFRHGNPGVVYWESGPENTMM